MQNHYVVACLSIFLFLSPLRGAENTIDSLIARELQRVQVDPDSTVSMLIDAPVGFVFDFLASRPADYITDASVVEFDHSVSAVQGSLAAGSVRSITLANGEVLVQRFLQFNQPTGYAYFADMDRSTVSAPLDYSLASYVLTSEGEEQTRLNVSVVYRPSSRLLGFFVRRAFDTTLQRDFAVAAEVIARAWQEDQKRH